MTLTERLRAQLKASARRPVPHSGDLREDQPDAGVPAAVLIAVTDRPEPGLILTQRAATMRRHAGQVAFPGGRIDDDDASPEAAALREAHEEIALRPDAVTIIGRLTHYRSITGYEITPVLAVIPPDLLLSPHEAEVEAVFEVPLSFVLDPSNQLARLVDYQGAMRSYIEILWQDRRIWGATAAMLVNLAARLA